MVFGLRVLGFFAGFDPQARNPKGRLQSSAAGAQPSPTAGVGGDLRGLESLPLQLLVCTWALGAMLAKT